MKRYLISGGGTGGHIFPAISIANELKARDGECEILFVGAKGRMEMKRVPEAGYEIVGLNVQGFHRHHLWKNIGVLYNLIKSMCKVKKVIQEFKPDVAIGVGGYASGAALRVAENMGIPVVIQEQNGFAGVTNKLLAKKAERICVAYDGMEKYFPAEKIVVTGNPVRQNLFNHDISKAEALAHFGLKEGKKTLLVIGGSLGARTINHSLMRSLRLLTESDVQVIWQTGKYGYSESKEAYSKYDKSKGSIVITDFVKRMDYAYAAADVVISRAGASSISELCLLGKACILVPSPNVAEDHQTHNAMALSSKGAAILIKDQDARDELVDTALTLLGDDKRRTALSRNIATLGIKDSAAKIVDEIEKVISNRI
ncbi:MAG: undecaprenyldiphospho-muramoylpentapeptide beta-N-acetylglucosaminyltransferase [Paludibacteraceae bacterium]|nr:undecaprenyldiphospho-muramoylpentapeptide beta-N-acetylglucosaminyltransferase [Paludibacteraceae bacterium]